MRRVLGTIADPRSTEELLRFSVAARTRWASRTCISALGFRDPEIIFPFAEGLCQSESMSERLVGAEMAGELGGGYFPREYSRWAARMLLAMLRRATDPRELSKILKWMSNHQYVSEHFASEAEINGDIFRLSAHHVARVRLGVVRVIMDFEHSLSLLLQLMRDPSPRVRDWATFAVGTIRTEDSTEIREALADRLDDRDQDTFAEAVHGLARRHDPRAFDVLLGELEAGEPTTLLFDAAAALGDLRLLPLLEELFKRSESDEGINIFWLSALGRSIEELQKKAETADQSKNGLREISSLS